MKKMNLVKLFIAAFLCLIAATTFSQRSYMRYGKLSPDEINMDRFPADTTAKAVILGDFGKTHIQYRNTSGFDYSYTRHVRIKVFDKDAFDLGNFKVYLYSGGTQKERLTGLKGVVYTPDGSKLKKTKIKRSDSFTEEISEFLTSINFTMPNLEEGSIFEVQYTVVSPFLFTLPMWTFQREYPTVFSEYQTLIPEYFSYKPLMQGFLSLSHRDFSVRRSSFTAQWEEQGTGGNVTKHSAKIDYDERVTVYRMENVPAFSTEPYMNSPVNYLAKIEHELEFFRWQYGPGRDYSTSWEQLNKRLLESESFGKLLNRSGFMSEEAQKIKANTEDPQERMIAAYQLIQENMTWNRSNGIYAKKNMRRTWADKQGNAADINLMLVVLLRELEIDTDPVILSTRNHGIINPAQIMLDKFNYVIVHAQIGDKVFLLDATDKRRPYYLLPERCLNGEGRLVAERRSRWVALQPSVENLTHSKSIIKVKPCGSMDVRLQRDKTNYNRLSMETNYRSYDKVEDFMDRFEANNQGIDLVDFEIQNLDDWSKPLQSIYSYEIPAEDNSPKGMLYINPLLTDRLHSNPFRLEERAFPVDFTYPSRRQFDITIEIPEGYAVEEMPRNATFSMPGRAAVYRTAYNNAGNGTITVQVEMEIGKNIFIPNEYKALKDFHTRIVEEQARAVVLKKL